jgi:recombination protein RecR
VNIAEPLQIAIEEFNKFPGIGKKTAQRLAIYLLKCKKEDVDSFLKAVSNLKEKLKFCSICFSITENDVCEICKSQKRDKTIICVVEEASDVFAIEKTNEYNGLYHVLGGVLSPLSGISQEDLTIKELLNRLKSNEVKEIILGLNPDTEGETTSLYLAKLIKPLKVKVSRIARGLPIGGDLEFADEATIGRAVLGRIEI